MEWKIKVEIGILIKSKCFWDVVNKVIISMEYELVYGGGKVSYKDYVGVLNKYYIFFFDRIYIIFID